MSHASAPNMTKPLETSAGDGAPRENDNAARLKGTSLLRWDGLRRRAKGFLAAMPASVDARVKKSPYGSVALAAGVGVGVGILLGSRVMRAVLASTASYAVVEVSRVLFREWLATGQPPAPTAPRP